MLGVHRSRDIRKWITRRMDHWDRGLYEGLVGGAEAEGSIREFRVSRGGEEEDKAISWTYHSTVMSSKLR